MFPSRGAAVTAAFLLGPAGGCGDRAGSPEPSPQSVEAPRTPLANPDEGAGADVCAACHADIVLAQAEHPMAQTAGVVTQATRDRWFSHEMLARAISWPAEIGAQPAYEIQADGRVRFTAPGGDPPDVPVDAVFGSGLRGLTPVSFAAGRRLRELRLSFSHARDGWFPTPGGEEDEDALGNLDTAEESANCIGCHATALAWEEDGRFDPHGAVLGVSCERCHGSGIAHVEAQSAGGDPGSIFHPGRLAPADQVAFCGQCHRQPTDFEPREILARDPLLARHAGASLMMSACFRESAPETTITCTECHDPHLPDPAGPVRTRAVCSRCHEDIPSLHRQTVVTAESDCAGCHLPTESEAFHGTPFTDHWIRLPGDPPTPASAAGRRELAWLEELYRRRIPEENPPAKAARIRAGLAELLHIRGARGEAQALLRDALDLGADYETRLKAGALFRDGGRIPEALSLFREAAGEQPRTPHAHYELGETLLQSGDFASAVGPLTIAAELSADSAGVHAALGAALHGADRPTEAVTAFRDALRIEAELPAALGPLAGILAAHPRRDLRDPAEAVRLAERLAGQFSFQEPRSLDLLGAALAAAGDFSGAMQAAERAANLATNAGAAADAAAFSQRLALYRAGRPYVGPLPTTDVRP
ncbi:MAG: tetratricopeptide repeat protein [Acidobacteria bacterium]|nr:tetratricopeptide repeat protein [Acidobacteriota bacterium]MYF15474.1 tetratricopeptide repeat protein [Acidobacteriota bacterium]MYI96205.1 tetratricopeptide repeat protein [Acidobacteriota bacterium]